MFTPCSIYKCLKTQKLYLSTITKDFYLLLPTCAVEVPTFIALSFLTV